MSTTISSLMQRRVHAVDIDASIAEVERLFAEHHLSWAPVLESNAIVIGVISAIDLLQFRAQDRDAAKTRAWQMCTYKPISVGPDAPLADVARQMVEHHIHHVIVADGTGIAGVVSSMDFVRTFVRG